MIAAGRAPPPAAGRLAFEDRVAWLVLDRPGAPANTLSSPVLGWLGEQVGRLEAEVRRGGIDGLVILSGKPHTFAVGPDVEELLGLEDEGEALALAERGHRLTERLTALPCATVAAIEGECLGAGLELALACDLRVAAETAATRLGLPEAPLGLVPGLGGTQRLPRLVGVDEALDLILTGKPVDAATALRLGLVDATCPPAELRAVALRLVAGGGAKGVRRRSLRRRWRDWAARVPGLERLVRGPGRKKVLRKSGGGYPASRVAIHLVRDGMRLPLPRALGLEAGAFARLATSGIARSLLGIVSMERDVGDRARALAARAREVERVAVLGAGPLGMAIAQGLARAPGGAGREVVVCDPDRERLARGMRLASAAFDGWIGRGRMTGAEKEAAMNRILPTTDPGALRAADLVMATAGGEAAPEDRPLRELRAAGAGGPVLAAAAAAVPVAPLAEAAAGPEDLGMCFTWPIHQMPLLEVVRGPGVPEEAVATAFAVGLEMGKTVIAVHRGPASFTGRLLGALLDEAVRVLSEGARVEQIDGALRGWGWAAGPLETLDRTGLDASWPALETMVEAGRTGRRSGKGFYDYAGGEKRPDPAVYELLGWRPARVSDEEIVERCWLRMLGEAARSLEDGTIESPVDVEIGAVFGLGFPPFRGGLLEEADRVGLPAVVRKLSGYAARHGERFAPAPLLERMATGGTAFRS